MVNKSHQISIQQTAQEIASLLPYIVQGVPSGTLAKAALTQTQFRMVVILSLKAPCTMSAMASQMKVSMPTVTGLVDRLVEAKYIVRKAHPKDRRQIMIELTPQAFEFLKVFEGVYAKRWVEILQILNDKETAQMLAITRKLNQGLKVQNS
jgi:DNA-binding MarR family transcriptional regulator